jgi:hypothetical protein
VLDEPEYCFKVIPPEMQALPGSALRKNPQRAR